MGLYADIIVDISQSRLDQTFQYRVPEELQDSLEPGNVVEVPFGRGDRVVRGYVLRVTEHAACPPEKLKTIVRQTSTLAGSESGLVSLALWMRNYYGCTTVQALRTVLPFRQKASVKKKKRIVLTVPPDEAERLLAECRRKHQTARARLLEALIAQPELPQEIVTGSLRITSSVWKTLEEQGCVRCETEQVYRTPALIEGLREAARAQERPAAQNDSKELPRAQERPARQNDSKEMLCAERVQEHPVRQSDSKGLPCAGGVHEAPDTGTAYRLNADQQAIVDAVCADRAQHPAGRYLIHGVTGSGKTAVYMELIARTLAEGRQAILLIPEISLTYQNVLRFYRRFGDRISILHSRLSASERYDQFERAKSGDVDVMIGPRSALFTPFERLGMIIIDEEHEDSYKSESAPRYDARQTAAKRAELEGAQLVLGSATPSLESYFDARNGASRLFTMKRRATGGSLPEVMTVDMREELRSGNRSILSRTLQEQLAQCLAEHRQAMLFLNRRGYSGFISCRSCGHVMKCPHCDVSLSLHRGGRLVCHYCGYEEPAVTKCPVCGSGYIGGFRAGTQQIEDTVAALFPQARILRMDGDTTKGKDGHAEILRAFADHEADILIGTQMIVKGHDFPNVTLVGILAADLSLNVSDYHAAERTFQLLTQAAGRAGRGDAPGNVVIQTYEPEHYAVVCAAAQEYETFYERELMYRRLSGYPPVGDMMSVHCASEDADRLAVAVDYLARFVRQAASRCGASVIGPSDEAVAKINDVYRKALYVKHEQPKTLTAIKNLVEQYIEMNTGFNGIRINFERR